MQLGDVQCFRVHRFFRKHFDCNKIPREGLRLGRAQDGSGCKGAWRGLLDLRQVEGGFRFWQSLSPVIGEGF